MESRSIPFGLAAAFAAFLIAKIIKILLTSIFGEPFSGPYLNITLEAIYSLPWLAGGFVAGYLSDNKPLKNGAATGATYGAIYCLIGFAMIATQTHGLHDRLSQLNFAAVAVVKFSFLFILVGADGKLTHPAD
jgi:putative membrane protein (TIGR04086 family)